MPAIQTTKVYNVEGIDFPFYEPISEENIPTQLGCYSTQARDTELVAPHLGETIFNTTINKAQVFTPAGWETVTSSV